MLNSFFANYFGFNKQQRNGLLVLMFISFVLLLVRIIYPSFIKPDNIQILNLPLIERSLDSFTETNNYSNKSTNVLQQTSTTLFVFNPNKVTREQLLQLGFKPKVAKGFINYRNKGFVFKQKSDVKKVYGVSDKFYSKLEPYILIENETKKETIPQENKSEQNSIVKKQTQQQLDLNTADSIALVDLKGIGPSFAKRILKYRTILGGYVSVEQLKEVYGFTDELYNQVNSFFIIGTSPLKKINLNTDDFKIINKHPYLSYELTKNICNVRRKTKLTPSNTKDILNDEVLYKKVMPYLSFE